MKAVRIHSYGGRDKISIEDVPRPELHEGEVLVRVHDAGVNPVDWKIREGLLKELMPVDFPLTLGQDFAGVIEELGPGASRFKRGDEVFGFAHGSYAEFVNVNENAIALKPKNLDFATAASIPTAGLTAWQIVVDVAKVHQGQLVLIHGAAGGVGSFATQLAKWKGATIVANASQDDFPYLREIGVDDLIDYRTQKFEDRLFDVDVVIDLVGGAVLGRSRIEDLVKFHGQNSETRAWLCRLYSREHLLNKSAESCLQAVDSDPGQADAYLFLATSFRDLEKNR